MQRRDLDRLLLEVLCAIGATAIVGCEISVPGGAGGSGAGGSGAGAGGGVTSGGGTTPTTTTSNTTHTSSTTTGGGTCFDALVSSTPLEPDSFCQWGEGSGGPYSNGYLTCFELPESGECEGYDRACIRDTYGCGLSSSAEAIACGPLTDSGECCYVVVGYCPAGRPLIVDSVARVAEVVERDDWRAAPAPALDALDARTRAALADAWTREGLSEHASVASFARFVLQLLAVGAPAALVSEAQRAMADEIEHARLCFGLASAYAGTPLGPAALDISGVLSDSVDRRAIAIDVAREGAIAETVSAAIVAAARDAASDPAVKSALSRIAHEEAAHAALAWRYLAWAIATDREALGAALAPVFADAARHVAVGAVTDLPGDDALLRAHGYLPLDERRRVARAVLGGVIAPAASALLSARPMAGASSLAVA
jgi:hypothetical protein